MSSESGDSDRGSSDHEMDEEPRLSDSGIRNIRKESLKLLSYLEKDYRHDIGVHAYSAFLVKTKLQSEFITRWGRWPLSIERVPDPRLSKIYIDEADIGPDNSTNRKRKREQTPELEEFENLSDPVANLKLELNSYFSRRIVAAISAYREATGAKVRPTAEPIRLPDEVMDKIVKKIDSITTALLSRTGHKHSDRVFKVGSWRDVVLTEGSRDLDAVCQRLFENYNYKFERFVPQSSDDADSEEIVEDSENSEESSSSEESTGEDGDISARKRVCHDFEVNLIAKQLELQQKEKEFNTPISQTFDHKLTMAARRAKDASSPSPAAESEPSGDV